MTFADFIDSLQRYVELIGPNVYLQAAIIAFVFVVTNTFLFSP